MIFYFSGTGNSHWVAKQIGLAFNDQIISIADELNTTNGLLRYTLKENERVFFVFPVHSWGPAVLVKRFISRLSFDNYAGQAIYAICTCGDNCGYTDRMLKKALSKRGLLLTKTYSIQMPNNYILMKGFGVDDKDTETSKLTAAPKLLDEIITDIRTDQHKTFYITGSKPFLKSYIIHPLFCSFVVGKNKFYATDACTSCGLCAKLCPTKTIVMQNGHPTWKDTCIQCTACIHHCPVRAIEYGNITQNQGRYIHKEISGKSTTGN